MSILREQLHQLLESLTEGYLPQVRDFLSVLNEEPEELSTEELAEVRKGEEEIKRGEWVKWEDVRRSDVLGSP